jgi:hypothetical protein
LQKLAPRMELPPGETLLAGVTGWETGFGIAHVGRVVLATDSYVYVYHTRVSPAGLKAKHPRGSVPVTVRFGMLTVGDERIILPLNPRAYRDARQVALLASA